VAEGRRPPSRARVTTAVLALALLQVACLHHWQERREAAPELLAGKRPEIIRVTLRDSSRVILHQPVLRADSLWGVVSDTAVAIPLGQVAHLAVRRAGASTPARIAAGAVFVGLVVYFAAVWHPL